MGAGLGRGRRRLLHPAARLDRRHLADCRRGETQARRQVEGKPIF